MATDCPVVHLPCYVLGTCASAVRRQASWFARHYLEHPTARPRPEVQWVLNSAQELRISEEGLQVAVLDDPAIGLVAEGCSHLTCLDLVQVRATVPPALQRRSVTALALSAQR